MAAVNAEERDPAVDDRHGWAIVAALSVTVTVSYGVLTYAFGVLLPSMQRDLGWSKAVLTGAFSLALLVSAVAGLAVGRLLDRHSPRLLMSAGSAGGTVLVLAWSRVHSVVTLYVVFALLGLVMACALYEPVFTVVTKWFAARRHAALTAVTLVGALASIVFSPLTQWLDASRGWRDALVVLALIFGAVTLPLHALVLRAPPRTTPEPGQAYRDHTVREALWTPPLWLLSLASVLGMFTWSAVVVHLVSLLVRDGIDPAFAAFAVGLLGIAQLPGRAIFGVIGRRLSERLLPFVVWGTGSLALALLAVDRDRWAVVVFALVFGASAGMGVLLRASLIADIYGRTNYGGIAAVTSAAANIARAAAPVSASLLILLPGGYRTLLWILVVATGVAAIAGAAAVGQAPRHRIPLEPVETQTPA